MDINRIKETDLFGRFFLNVQDKSGFEKYYCSLNNIRPLIGSERWLKNVTGFYINAENYDVVRLSYFTTSPNQTAKVVNDFVGESNLEHSNEPCIPHKKEVSAGQGNEELRFRKFLSVYTQIGLDIMKEDLFNARCLLATFRWQIMRASMHYKPHFVKTFENQSPFYNLLSPAEKSQFWSDLANRPNPSNFDWAHFFVNMVFGCDWIWKEFFTPKSPLSIKEINKRIEELGLDFKIPENWSPKK